MGKSLKWLFWTLLFLIMMLAIDQFFVQVPPLHPAHAAVSRFYQDFRQRLVALTLGGPPVKTQPVNPKSLSSPKSIEAVIDQKVLPKAGSAPTTEQARRYVYSDEQGVLQFAESLEEVPLQYRATAQPMSQ